MANTNYLRNIVEPELKLKFEEKHSCKLINLSNKQLQNIFNDMEPDLVAIDTKQSILHIGEITTSGFMGQKGKDYNINAGKKVYEAFSKFYLLLLDKEAIKRRLEKYYNIAPITNIKCHFIVPEGSRFINALGYKARLFETGIMQLETIKLDKDTEKLMLQVLSKAREESKGS